MRDASLYETLAGPHAPPLCDWRRIAELSVLRFESVRARELAAPAIDAALERAVVAQRDASFDVGAWRAAHVRHSGHSGTFVLHLAFGDTPAPGQAPLRAADRGVRGVSPKFRASTNVPQRRRRPARGK